MFGVIGGTGLDNIEGLVVEKNDPSNISSEAAAFVQENESNFNFHMRNILSTYCYSGLQYAYSTQMFTISDSIVCIIHYNDNDGNCHTITITITIL